VQKKDKINYNSLASKFKELLSKHKRVTIISHIRPDGDTISSALALYNTLKEEGITSELICKDSYLPIKYNFLSGFNRFKQEINYKDSLIVTLDCADLSRTGFDLSNKEIVNIDHHKSNTYFGTLNIVEIEVSTTVVLYKLLKDKFKITKEFAEAIYTGLLSDSQNFTTSLTTKDTLKIASELLDLGVDLQKVANRVNRYNSLSHTRALARAIDNMQLYFDGKVAIMSLSQDDIKATGAKYSDIDAIIDSAIALATVDIAILISKLEKNIKVSLRSKNADVSQIATTFGGGGHKNAAGFEVKEGKISDIKNKLLKEIKDYIWEEIEETEVVDLLNL